MEIKNFLYWFHHDYSLTKLSLFIEIQFLQHERDSIFISSVFSVKMLRVYWLTPVLSERTTIIRTCNSRLNTLSYSNSSPIVLNQQTLSPEASGPAVTTLRTSSSGVGLPTTLRSDGTGVGKKAILTTGDAVQNTAWSWRRTTSIAGTTNRVTCAITSSVRLNSTKSTALPHNGTTIWIRWTLIATTFSTLKAQVRSIDKSFLWLMAFPKDFFWRLLSNSDVVCSMTYGHWYLSSLPTCASKTVNTNALAADNITMLPCIKAVTIWLILFIFLFLFVP